MGFDDRELKIRRVMVLLETYRARGLTSYQILSGIASEFGMEIGQENLVKLGKLLNYYLQLPLETWRQYLPSIAKMIYDSLQEPRLIYKTLPKVEKPTPQPTRQPQPFRVPTIPRKLSRPPSMPNLMNARPLQRRLASDAKRIKTLVQGRGKRR